MGVLDSIIKQEMVGSRDTSGTSYETINANGNSSSVDVSGTEQGFIVSIDYINGVGTNIVLRVEGSSDNTSFSAITSADYTVTDASGNVIFDLSNINANYVRLSWEVTAGSMDIFVHLSGKRRH